MDTPSPLNIAENNNQTEGEVIQEIEEGSSNASKSKISASMQSLTKKSNDGLIRVEKLSKKSTGNGNVSKRLSRNTFS